MTNLQTPWKVFESLHGRIHGVFGINMYRSSYTVPVEVAKLTRNTSAMKVKIQKIVLFLNNEIV